DSRSLSIYTLLYAAKRPTHTTQRWGAVIAQTNLIATADGTHSWRRDFDACNFLRDRHRRQVCQAGTRSELLCTDLRELSTGMRFRCRKQVPFERSPRKIGLAVPSSAVANDPRALARVAFDFDLLRRARIHIAFLSRTQQREKRQFLGP